MTVQLDSYYNPVRTLLGAGASEQLNTVLADMQLTEKKVLLVVWQEAVLQLPAFAALCAEQSGYTVKSVCFTASNPTVEQLFALYQQTKTFAPQVVVAVGGGSILDVGKSLCCLYGKDITDADQLRQLINDGQWGSLQTRWIGVPTTAGTGSEVTCWATIWDPTQNKKRSVSTQQNYAYAALVDPLLTAGMPTGLAVSSALDAVAHAVESYWAKASNTVSQALALQAIRTVMTQIDGLFQDDPNAHLQMAQGSMLAGMAFSNTKTTACHSISYPLTMQYAIPHGAAVSMLLAAVLRLNQLQVQQLPALMQALQVTDADALQVRIHSLLHRAGLKATLKEWGVPREALPELAALGLTKGRADNNPVTLDTDMVLQLLYEIYE